MAMTIERMERAKPPGVSSWITRQAAPSLEDVSRLLIINSARPGLTVPATLTTYTSPLAARDASGKPPKSKATSSTTMTTFRTHPPCPPPSRGRVWVGVTVTMFLTLFIGLLKLLHIFPDITPLGRISQEKRRVICRKKMNTFVGMKVATQSRNGRIGSKEGLGSKGAQGTYEPRPYGHHLPVKKRDAGSDLVRFRISIPWRATLYDITNIDILSGQSNGSEYPGKELACLTHKRLALYVFFVAWSFAYQDQLCPGIPSSKNDMFAPNVEFASPAGAKILLYHVQGFCHGLCIPLI